MTRRPVGAADRPPDSSHRAGCGSGRRRLRRLLDRRARAAGALRPVSHLDRRRLVGDHGLQRGSRGDGARPRPAGTPVQRCGGARRRPGGVPLRVDHVRAGRQSRPPDRRQDRAGRGCRAAPRRVAAGARRAHRLGRGRGEDLGSRGDLRPGARARARGRPDAGLQLARDLRRAGARGRAGPARRRPLACARGRRGGMASIAPPDAPGERLPRAALRRSRRRAVPRGPARDQRLELLADRRRGHRERPARCGDRGPSARTPASSPDRGLRRCRAARRRIGRPCPAAVCERRLHRLGARALRRRARPFRARPLGYGARPERGNDAQRNADGRRQAPGPRARAGADRAPSRLEGAGGGRPGNAEGDGRPARRPGRSRQEGACRSRPSQRLRHRAGR